MEVPFCLHLCSPHKDEIHCLPILAIWLDKVTILYPPYKEISTHVPLIRLEQYVGSLSCHTCSAYLLLILKQRIKTIHVSFIFVSLSSSSRKIETCSNLSKQYLQRVINFSFYLKKSCTHSCSCTRLYATNMRLNDSTWQSVNVIVYGTLSMRTFSRRKFASTPLHCQNSSIILLSYYFTFLFVRVK